MPTIVDFPDTGGNAGPLSFAEPRRILRARTLAEVAPTIAEAERLAGQGAWCVGFVAYEAAPAFDPALPVAPADPSLPLAWFAVHDRPRPAAGIDIAPGNFHCGPWSFERPAATIAADIARLRADIGDGRHYQVNLSARLRADFSGHPLALFHALRRAQPGGYALYLDTPDWQILSVSPELFFDRCGDRLSTRPMKGTAPRHADPAADRAAADRLLASAKERAENVMIVDLLRNDLARVAALGSVRVPRRFELEALATAWQMTSTVECRLRPEIGLAEIFAALFPCGSVTGAPKIAAMAAIVERERIARGIYCGALGLIRPGGHATFNVAIRSLRLDRHRRSAECGIGSGITYDSSEAGEYAEWLVKRRFLLRASAGFALIETLRLENGHYWLLDGHKRRLAASADHFGFPWRPDKIDAALAAIAAAHGTGRWRVRLLLDRDGHPTGECQPLEPAPAVIAIRLADRAIAGDNEWLRHKTTERRHYPAPAADSGIYDLLLWNERDELTEFTRGNLVVQLGGRKWTPPADAGLLPGVLRQDLLDRGEIAERPLPRALLAQADACWFINSVRGWLPARPA